MPVYPVIMCGGSGTRLWPSSRPAHPKQLVPLIGERSPLQETALRVRDLAGDGGEVLVVTGVAHAPEVRRQLDALGIAAIVLAEPEPRDSSAAIAAAACWIAARRPDGVAVIVASDHHIPDAQAFRTAVTRALGSAAGGAIVTLGVRPTEPATAYGYIQPAQGADEVRAVAAFVEKPDAERARAYMADGYLWNSGNFVARADTLLAEFEAHAPDLLTKVSAGLAEGKETQGALVLGASFRAASKISFDYAVMEKTDRAAVLPVTFDWSDLGAWDAVWSASPKDERGNSLSGGAVAVDSSDILVRAPAGVQVGVIGAHRVAVIVEAGSVLVTSFDQAQSVKAVAETATLGRPEAWTIRDLPTAAATLSRWLATAALPVWATLGADPANGGFREGLTALGCIHDPRRRMRSQSRQVMVYACAAAHGLVGPWADVARRGAAFMSRGQRSDGLFANVLTPSGEVTDNTAHIYEQAFVLLALEALARIGEPGVAARAVAIRDALQGFRHPSGGFREVGPQPYQANAHMHLFEAALAWEPHDGEGGWAALADEIAELALDRFIDTAAGRINEFFAADWTPLQGDDGLLEPGHHFEWAWLLTQWAERRGRADGRKAARRLYETGRTGLDARRGVAVNSVWADGSVRDADARLWPQTELLKAALIMGEEPDALTACNALVRYLDTPVRGVWRDRMRLDGGFVEEPGPASSFYHLLLAILELERLAGAISD